MKRTTSKAGRLLLLYRLREAGVIGDDNTLQEIGNALGVNRSTILRDLAVIDQVEAEYTLLMASQPWMQRYYTAPEFANEIGASADTVRAMLRDGLIKAHKTGTAGGGRWVIPIAEADKFK
ncbi:MAG: helix-turn-helix domain-containing protein [Chloroflexi bacterium]|nr:helix-turn-helix domain-containing protein [Chloroflexota bacterium]